tara:strand:- start:1473 stop:1748 length:276 start_codon:yes stop_codon:yes gene_type:complete
MEDILPTLFTYDSGDELASPSWALNTYTDIHIVDNGEESSPKRFEVRQYKHYDPSDDHLWILQSLGSHKTLIDAMHDAMIYFAKEFPTKAL